MVCMNLNKEDFIAKKIEQYNKDAISEIGDDAKEMLLCEDNNDKVEIDEFDNGTITAHSSSKFGYVSFQIRLDDDDIISIIEYLNKRMNRFKNILESTK